MSRRRKTTKSLAAPNPSLPGLLRMFSLWSRIQKSMPRRVAGASLNSKTENLPAKRSLKPASPATSLPKATTSSLRGMHRDSSAPRHISRSMPGLSSCKHAVNLRNDGGALSDRRRNALGRARPHIANRENAGAAGLKRQERTGTRSAPFRASRSRDHEPFLVHRDTAIKPGRIRVGANEEEEVTQGTAVRYPRRPTAKRRCNKAAKIRRLRAQSPQFRCATPHWATRRYDR